MPNEIVREYYKIRLLDNVGHPYRNEWHHSNNGTDQWESLAKIKSILTRGVQGGYKGKIVTIFTNYEVVKFTEYVRIEKEVISL
jgi:hypothetical protein